MTTEKQFSNLSEFAGRDVELFRSSDEHSTAIYFTEAQKDNAGAAFELLRFGLEGGDHLLYIRYPNTTYFIELFGSSIGSGRGDMIQSKFRNVWLEKDKADITIYSQGENLLLIMGGKNVLTEFNFMKKVASYDKGNPYCHPYPNEKFFNSEELKQTLSMSYLKLPDSVRKIAYCLKADLNNSKYFLVDYPAYNMKYDNFRFFRIDDKQYTELKILSVDRARDGGTTLIKVLDERNIVRELFCPSPLMHPAGKYIWNINEIVEPASPEETSKVVEILGLNVEG